jgi:hypothetical protein
MSENLIVPTMAEMQPKENNPEFCFVVVQEVLMIAKKITKAFVRF